MNKNRDLYFEYCLHISPSGPTSTFVRLTKSVVFMECYQIPLHITVVHVDGRGHLPYLRLDSRYFVSILRRRYLPLLFKDVLKFFALYPVFFKVLFRVNYIFFFYIIFFFLFCSKFLSYIGGHLGFPEIEFLISWRNEILAKFRFPGLVFRFVSAIFCLNVMAKRNEAKFK
jgi:hypothetical protein